MGLLSSLKRRKNQSLVGVDVSASAIKLVELSGSEKDPEVTAFAVAPLPEGAVVDRQIVDQAALAEALRVTVRRAGCSTRRAAMAMPGASIISKIIPMPASMNEDDLEEQIQVEADQYIPYQIDDVRLDFEVIGPTAGDDSSVDVLVAACRRDHVDRVVETLEMAEMEPAVIDAEPFAMENGCIYLRHQMPDQGVGRTVAVVDIGNLHTHVNVLHDLESIFSREITVGGRQLTEEIARHYDLDLPAAAVAKKENSLADDYHDMVLAPFFDEVAQHIDRSLQVYFSSARAGDQIDQLIVAGGTAYLPGIEEHLSRRLELPVERARPLSALASSRRARRGHLEREEAALLIALGLASRTFDKPR